MCPVSSPEHTCVFFQQRGGPIFHKTTTRYIISAKRLNAVPYLSNAWCKLNNLGLHADLLRTRITQEFAVRILRENWLRPRGCSWHWLPRLKEAVRAHDYTFSLSPTVLAIVYAPGASMVVVCVDAWDSRGGANRSNKTVKQPSGLRRPCSFLLTLLHLPSSQQ